MKYLHHARAERHAGRGRQPVLRARARALLGAVGRRSRRVFGTRLADDWFAVRHRRRPRVPDAACFMVLVAGGRGSTATSSRARPRASRRRAAARGAPRLGSARAATAARRAREMQRFARHCWPAAPNARSSSGPWASRSTPTACDTIEALVNVGLARGLRRAARRRGLMPIRGHSGVQGGAEVGCAPGLDDEPRARAFEPRSGDSRAAALQGLDRGGDGRCRAARGERRRLLDRRRQLPGDAARSRRRAPARSPAAWARASTRTSCCPRSMLLPPRGHGRAVSRPRPATSRRAAAPRPRPSGGSSSRRRCAGGAIGSAKAGVGGVRRGGGARASGARRAVRFAVAAADPRRDRARRPALRRHRAAARARATSSSGAGRACSPTAAFAHAGRQGPLLGGRARGRDGRAEGPFHVPTRRGKQFNSMVQRDGRSADRRRRDDVLDRAPRTRPGWRSRTATACRLRSRSGVRWPRAPHRRRSSRGNLEVHWPEGNALLSRDEIDRLSREPDYNAVVTPGEAVRPDLRRLHSAA